MSVFQSFIDYLHQRSREHYDIYRFVGLRDHRSLHVRARLAILERLSRLEEWDESRD